MLTIAKERIAETQPAGRRLPVRPGGQPRDLRHLQGRPVHEERRRPRRREHRVRQHALATTGMPASASTTCSPIRPTARSGRRIEAAVRARKPSGATRAASAPGLPRISDGQLLFLQHMLGRMKPPEEGGSRVGIVHERLAALHRRRGQRRERNPPLDPGERLAGGHRRPARAAVLQHRHRHLRLDPHQPQGSAARKGKVQLIDATGFWEPMRKSLGDKRREIPAEKRRDSASTRLSKRVSARNLYLTRALRLPGKSARPPERMAGWPD